MWARGSRGWRCLIWIWAGFWFETWWQSRVRRGDVRWRCRLESSRRGGACRVDGGVRRMRWALARVKGSRGWRGQ
ncbi:hypothetical protein C8F04DRAFT_1095072 [Mycena alexandri]|uniref:Uncharacterized protein n=1 Tax=Mycena alexandri TaxID=1745969 RepID=A0AAD6SZM0_9AGAR|nr:hypothetical protein C8F04DRAFT_1095072 [Mycena alexandri]